MALRLHSENFSNAPCGVCEIRTGIQAADSVHAKIEHKLYHKIGNQTWMEETTRRTLPENELPPAIRQKIRRGRTRDTDITEDIELELGMSI